MDRIRVNNRIIDGNLGSFNNVDETSETFVVYNKKSQRLIKRDINQFATKRLTVELNHTGNCKNSSTFSLPSLLAHGIFLLIKFMPDLVSAYKK